MAFAVTNYTVFTQSVPFGDDTVQIINYVYPENLTDAQAGTEVIVPIMQLFDTLFGLYPFQSKQMNWDTLMVFQHQYDGEIFKIRLPFQPQGLEFDPDLWLVATHQIVLSDAALSANVLTLTISPNPAHHLLQIQYFSNTDMDGRLQVFDAAGRLLLRQTHRPHQGENQLNLDISALPVGVIPI